MSPRTKMLGSWVIAGLWLCTVSFWIASENTAVAIVSSVPLTLFILQAMNCHDEWRKSRRSVQPK